MNLFETRFYSCLSRLDYVRIMAKYRIICRFDYLAGKSADKIQVKCNLFSAKMYKILYERRDNMDEPHVKIPWGKVFKRAFWKTFYWFGVTVVASTLPLLLTLGFYKITGKGTNDVRAVKYIRDIVLIAYTIIVSLLAMVLDEEKNLGGRTRAFLSLFSFFSSFICGGIYFFIFGINISGEDVADSSFFPFFCISLVLSVIHLIFVFIVETVSYKRSEEATIKLQQEPTIPVGGE